ncbi:hypothetical protein K227x_29110 [Rubripirellula lacrimiformis]|uniref:23S rRNA m(2)G2445 methyltransferase n=1 Tax=Rubripirellula lacrimiformis TaxID=1930273 RepID=A0A517NBK3_9BACT|nr:SAM-dependent methyltransferase [Rubripirellula lacrimiformis]QDT04519.1 hypothetical protein K227x_29110 [Rubripirellula lacrimiformis]
MTDNRYRLIDFGEGRKLESVGGYLIDRPSPAASWSKRQSPENWQRADAHFDADRRKWTYHNPWPTDQLVDCDGFQMPFVSTPFGHIGVFPEQFDNWRWLCKPVITEPSEDPSSVPTKPAALNLFGYTGASTMVLIKAGYQVAHVDAAKPNVQAVRGVATSNGWPDPPIRYLIDDAAKFAAREVRRRRMYHTIVMDPPAYGHGPNGRAWRLDRDIWPLLDDCLRLVDPKRFRMLISGHSPEVDHSDIVTYLAQSDLIDTTGLRIDTGRSQLIDEGGRSLDAGFYVRIETIDA